jgi:hypothetical protein
LLDALAGHGNFVAGLFALNARNPMIDVWNHNSGFEESFAEDGVADVPLESAVCLSLSNSQQPGGGKPAKIIHLGFSFAPYGKDAQGRDVVPQVWLNALALVASGRKPPLLVVPAGNQGMANPRYPAAMNWRFPGEYPWVIGVASLSAALNRSQWSNFGEWVSCAAIGEHVHSTFLAPGQPWAPEEAPGAQQDYEGWATWSGTSFAAPKVAGLLADWISASPAATPPVQIWQDLRTKVLPADPALGAKFPF